MRDRKFGPVYYPSYESTHVRDDSSDFVCAGPSSSRDEEQQLHQILVNIRTGWLDNVHLASTDILFQLYGKKICPNGGK